jgi:3,4-dihydroxy 2-butanone 4-phosphate synthase/GTP cyclohydrolase II
MDGNLVQRTTCARIPTAFGTFQLCHYIDRRDCKEHLALVMGEVDNQEPLLVRIHSECFTGDVLGSQRCDCGEQLQEAMRLVAERGRGVILYLRQEGRGIGLEEKLKAYNLQDKGYDTVDANILLGHPPDKREYSAAALMLRDLGVGPIQLLTNNPAKIAGLQELGVYVVEQVPIYGTFNAENATYLTTKARRMHHWLALPSGSEGVSALSDYALLSLPSPSIPSPQ